jgi:hypothetical protein
MVNGELDTVLIKMIGTTVNVNLTLRSGSMSFRKRLALSIEQHGRIQTVIVHAENNPG